MTVTRPYLPRLSVIYDFDKTLADDSFSTAIDLMGLDRATFDADFLDPMGDGWDPVLKKGTALIAAGEATGSPLDRSFLQRMGERLGLFNEVLKMPDRLRQAAHEVHPDADVGIHILSAGFTEFIDTTDIARLCDSVSAGAFHFEDDRAVAVRRTISTAEKPLYLRAHAEGVSERDVNAPGATEAAIPEDERAMLYDQMIYVGDGASDLQAFGFLEARGGLTVAIDAGDGIFDADSTLLPGQRVQAVSPPDYADDGDLMRRLRLAVRAAASRLALRAP